MAHSRRGRGEVGAAAIVPQLDSSLIIKENISRFDVAMNEALRVEEGQVRKASK